jgi:hypothetical protein
MDYRMIGRSDGKFAGGVLRLSVDMQQNGARPLWLGYLSTPDVDGQLSAIVSSIPIDDWQPTSEEFEGYTGNAGNTLDRWYHRSAIVVWHRNNEASRRLATIPGVGTITASAIVATIANPREFKSARHFAAFLGLTPKEHSTGGRHRLGRISKQGDAYIRRLLVLGGTSLVRYARGAGGSAWAKQLLARRPPRIAPIALANKTARIIWAMLTRGGVYQPAPAQAA